jgi:hypothetical protein
MRWYNGGDKGMDEFAQWFDFNQRWYGHSGGTEKQG